MKYSAAILLALFSLTAASILDHQDDVVLGRVRVTNKHNVHDRHDNRDNNDDNVNTYINENIRGEVDQVVQKQKTVLQLLTNLQQKNIYQNLVHLGNNFNPIQIIDRFNNQQAVKKFFKNYENDNFLPLNEVFSPTNQQHQNQAAQLFTFLYSAQDWNTLKQAAAWARDRFNTEQFAYVFTAVVLNHPTTQGVVIPALYEIIPHAFVPATTLHKIYRARVEGVQQLTLTANYTNQNRNNINYRRNINENINNDNINNNNDIWGPHNPNSVFADNDGSLINNAGTTENPENKLSYFTEDIGVNDLHAKFHLQYPVFLGINNNKNYYTSNLDKINNNVNTINNNNLDVKRGEAFYFAHQQLYARYVLERLSNDLPIPHPVNLDDKIKTGYNPNLQHANGQAVPIRPPNTNFLQQQVEITTNNNNALQPNNNQAQHPIVYEERIQQAAESGYVLNQDGSKTKLTGTNGIGVLANLIAAPASSLNPDYYGDFWSTAKNAIGNIVDPNNQNGVAPGVVSNYVTAARDPAYYQLLAKLNQIFNNLQNKLGPYTQSELSFSGVKIQNIDISNLVTYLETVKVNVNNAVPRTVDNINTNVNNNENTNVNGNDNLNYHVVFQRLTNKPFNYKLTVQSNKNTNAIVRIFIGPKYDSNGQLFTLPQASQYFVQLDQFKVQLHNGQNQIRRNSQESNVNVNDTPSFQKLWNRVELAHQGQASINKGDNQVLGLPLRAQIPKGKVHGQQFILYAIINSVENINGNNEENTNINSSEEVIKNYSEENMETMVNDEQIMINNNNNDNNNNNNNDNLDELVRINNKLSRNVRDNRSILFPFDRPVHDSNFNTANQYFKTVTVYHKINNDN